MRTTTTTSWKLCAIIALNQVERKYCGQAHWVTVGRNDVTLNLNGKRNNKRHHCVGVEWVIVRGGGQDEWHPFNWFLLLLLRLLLLLLLLSLCLPLFRRLHELIGAHHVARGLLHGAGAQVYGRHALEHCHCVVLVVLVLVGGLSLFLLLLLLCCFLLFN